MTVFVNYARYYDLLYRDKDYAGEAQFIHRLIQTNVPHTKRILELGCGTGNHAALLAEKGYDVYGVDISPDMLEIANERRLRLTPEIAERLQFSHGDIRDVRLNEKFDVVLSLFHVISYQTTNADLLAAFQTAKNHLKPGGIFIFDVWYGPAVLSERPTVRVKRLEDESIHIIRLAEPLIYPNENVVDVSYHIFIRDKIDDSAAELRETHKMRYLFRQEVDFLLETLNMKTINCREWMTDRETGFETWSVYWIVSC